MDEPIEDVVARVKDRDGWYYPAAARDGLRLAREVERLRADNAALRQDMTTAFGYLSEPKMDGSHVTNARDILEKRRRGARQEAK